MLRSGTVHIQQTQCSCLQELLSELVESSLGCPHVQAGIRKGEGGGRLDESKRANVYKGAHLTMR